MSIRVRRIPRIWVSSVLESMVILGIDSENRINIILCDQPELKATLKYSHFMALKRRIRLFFHMQGILLQETFAYIDHHQTEIDKKTTFRLL